MATKLVLHHYWRSSCSWRVRWALELKKLSYESRPVNLLTGEQRDPAFLALNPSGTVPCLEIDGVPVFESLAIIEWLEDTHPSPALLPKEPLAKLRVRELALLIAADTQPLQNPKVQKMHSDDPERRSAWAHHWIQEGLDAYEKRLAAGPKGAFSYGDIVTLADLCLIPQCYNALRFGHDLARWRRVKDIYERCLETAACERAAPHNQPGAQP